MKKEPQSKREKIVFTTQDLLLEKGFHAMRTEELCQLVPTTKGGLFHHFKNKEALSEAALKYYVRDLIKVYQTQLSTLHSPRTFLEALEAILNTFYDPRGCLLGIMAQELAHNEKVTSKFKQSLESFFDSWLQVLIDSLEQLQTHNKPVISFSNSELALYFMSLVEGSLLMKRSLNDQHLLENNFQHFKNYFNLLFGLSEATIA